MKPILAFRSHITTVSRDFYQDCFIGNLVSDLIFSKTALPNRLLPLLLAAIAKLSPLL